MSRALYRLLLIFLSNSYLLCALAAPANPEKLPADGIWRGAVNAGLSVASGNTRSNSANIGATGTALTATQKHHLYFTGLYGTQKDTQGVTSKTANLTRAGGKYDRNLNEQTFRFYSLDLEHDELQQLRLRSVFGFGVGKHVVKTSQTTFDVIGGLTYNREKFFDFTRNSVELLLGEETIHRISENTTVNQRLAIYPNLKETGQYRVQFDAGINTVITSRIGLQITLSDRYQSNPSPGIAKNDFLFLTSVSYKFGPK